MRVKRAISAAMLIALVTLLLFVTLDPLNPKHLPDFYVGVAFAYSHNLNDSGVIFSDLADLVDRVKGSTNLFIISIPQVSLNQTLLNQSCDYISAAGLNFIILYTDTTTYNYNLADWTRNANQTYGGKFLGVYRIDEPGGKELENAPLNGTQSRFLNPDDYNQSVRNYTGAAQQYVSFLGAHLSYLKERLYPTIFTSDFGLYWFDYEAGYETIFGEFVWNHSREMTISLVRGAAAAHHKDWGVIVTWMYEQEPYLESGDQLYDDLVLAYRAGAKYAVVFNYPNITQFGLLKDEHFNALSKFWSYIKNNPQEHGINRADVAYVLPAGYGFGMRRRDDNIWGIWNADELSGKVWDDANFLLDQYGSKFDIVYSDPQYADAIAVRYERLFFWNETVISS
ncbi:MAG: hypothetical protein NWE98_11870 [Candidatus Bathyarchaeota archaeon]|nr:hypothetical protein [Candidatus Bathyarchaeota archaeon]